MKLVYQCDFCSHTGTKEELENHELKCSFNPEKKLCWTCEHRFEGGAPISGSYNDCHKGKNCFEVEDEKQPCELWELESDLANEYRKRKIQEITKP